MPLYDFICPQGHEVFDKYVALAAYADAQICEVCGEALQRKLSMGQGLCYFEEGRERVITNMGHLPVRVRSHEEHKRLMKQHQVEWATPGRGRKGQWV